MLKFILVAATVILFLVFSIPVLVWESYLGKKDPEKRDWQSLHIVQWIFRIILKMAGSTYYRERDREHSEGQGGSLCWKPQELF